MVGNLTKKELSELILKKEIYEVILDNKNITYIKNETVYRKYKIGRGFVSKGPANFLGLIVFSVAIGAVSSKMGKKVKPFVEFIAALNNIVTELVMLVMW